MIAVDAAIAERAAMYWAALRCWNAHGEIVALYDPRRFIHVEDAEWDIYYIRAAR